MARRRHPRRCHGRRAPQGLVVTFAVHQAAVNAARASATEALRAFSNRHCNAQAVDAEACAARGLVSVSTSGFASSTAWANVSPWEFADATIQIDRAKARVTRLRKAVGVGAKALLNLAEGPALNNVMVTLTYDTRKAGAGAAGHEYWSPRHVSDYVRKVRAWFAKRCPGQRLRYVWVAELQQRGVLHYHAVFFFPVGVAMPPADKRGWWPHGMTNTLKANKPVAYLMKYASKVETKLIGGFPRGARISAVGGLDSVGAAIKRWCLWPAYVQGNASVNDPFRPSPGGGYLNHETGELLQSEYAPTGGGFSRFVRVHFNGRRIDAAGPFSWLQEHKDSTATGSAEYIH